VSVSAEVKDKYDEIKKKKTHRYLIFYIKDEKTIAIEKIGTNTFARVTTNLFCSLTGCI
jgi:hypothetical protein